MSLTAALVQIYTSALVYRCILYQTCVLYIHFLDFKEGNLPVYI
jgi:hypothetical protein